MKYSFLALFFLFPLLLKGQFFFSRFSDTEKAVDHNQQYYLYAQQLFESFPNNRTWREKVKTINLLYYFRVNLGKHKEFESKTGIQTPSLMSTHFSSNYKIMALRSSVLVEGVVINRTHDNKAYYNTICTIEVFDSYTNDAERISIGKEIQVKAMGGLHIGERVLLYLYPVVYYEEDRYRELEGRQTSSGEMTGSNFTKSILNSYGVTEKSIGNTYTVIKKYSIKNDYVHDTFNRIGLLSTIFNKSRLIMEINNSKDFFDVSSYTLD